MKTTSEGLLIGRNEVNALKMEDLDNGTYLDVYMLESERKASKRNYPITYLPQHLATHPSLLKSKGK